MQQRQMGSDDPAMLGGDRINRQSLPAKEGEKIIILPGELLQLMPVQGKGGQNRDRIRFEKGLIVSGMK